MIEFLKHVLNGQNQFASGGLLLMVIGAESCQSFRRCRLARTSVQF